MVTTAAIALLLLIALLAVPLRLIFRITRQQQLAGEVMLQWLFGLMVLRLPLTPDGHPPPKVSSTAGRRMSHNTPRLRLGAALRQPAFRNRIIRFTRDIWHAIHKQQLSLHLRVGIGDPAATGQLWSILGPLSGMLFMLDDADISIEPDFIDSTLELESCGNIRIIPLQIIYHLLALLLSPDIWHGLREARHDGN